MVQIREKTIVTVLLLLVAVATSHAQSADIISGDTLRRTVPVSGKSDQSPWGAPPNYRHSSLSVRTNLLFDVLLSPNIGVEWSFTPQWSLVGDYTWGDLSYKGGDRRYAVSEGSLEVRHYLSDAPRASFYWGVYALVGEFNYKLSDTGRQGNHVGLGFSGGYQFTIARRLQLDLGAALGYLHVGNGKRYWHREDVNLQFWREDFSRDTFMPLSLRATLVWNLLPLKKGGRL